jgi:hypothetical protein
MRIGRDGQLCAIAGTTACPRLRQSIAPKSCIRRRIMAGPLVVGLMQQAPRHVSVAGDPRPA